ncbi:MAG TPA: hypothetical protein VG406_02295 [Isosphaeraceae bacterium]|jgi:hypothetical protein|nr:hypothetical protein [Isosphaeraceae bacterium]
MRAADLLLDNPVLVKHVRSRLRPAQALPWAVVVLVLCILDAWACFSKDSPMPGGPATMALLGLQVLLLFFAGTAQINASLGGARESGILDFHRVSPLPPATITLGFLLGAPIREYILAGLTLPFVLAAATTIDAFDVWRGLREVAALEVVIVLTTWIVHSLAVLGCLTRKKPRGSIQGTIVTIIVLLMVGPYAGAAFWFGSQWIITESRQLNFFGWLIPWLAFALIYELPALGFFFLGASRKMKAERTHLYTKPQALAFLGTLATLAVAGTWHVGRFIPEYYGEPIYPEATIALATVYVLSVAAIMLSVTITPDGGEYVRGVLRAEHAGRRRPSPWSDAGSNRIAVFAMGAIVLLGTLAVVRFVGWPDNPAARTWRFGADGSEWTSEPRPVAGLQAELERLTSMPIAIGVLTVAAVGLGFQYFLMRARRSGLTLMFLFLFLTWLVPLLVGAIVGVTGGNTGTGLAIAALSPIFGVALSSNLGQPPNYEAIRLAALAPPITYAFVFNYLLVVVQRRLDRMVHVKVPKPEIDLSLAEVPGAL